MREGRNFKVTIPAHLVRHPITFNYLTRLQSNYSKAIYTLGHAASFRLHIFGTQAHAGVLTSSCGDIFHSQSEDRSGYGENLYLCGTTGSVTCYSPEGAMEALCEMCLLSSTRPIMRLIISRG